MGPVYTLDVAHPARRPAVVEQQLEDALEHVQQTPGLHVLKIIHGYGSSGRGGSTRTTVRNWAFARRRRWRAMIEGERYTYTDPDTRAAREELGQFADPDLHAGNPGVLVLWVR